MNKNLLILGAGQYGKIAKEIAEAMNCFSKIDFLDDNDKNALGKLNEMDRFVNAYSYAIVAIGNPVLRISLIHQLEEKCFIVAILVHPKAYISPTANIYPGCIVEPMAVVNSEAVIHKGVIISAGSIVNHTAMVGDVSHLDVGSIVKSNTIVPMGYKVEAGEVFLGTEMFALDIIGTDYISQKIDENADWYQNYVKAFGRIPSIY